LMAPAKLLFAFVLGALIAPAGEALAARDGCDACLKAANAGKIVEAARAASKCGDAEQKARCTKIVKRKAPAVAQAAVFNGECGKAKAIVKAAESMGAGSSSLRRAVKSCK
jgi:hypothetical protein